MAQQGEPQAPLADADLEGLPAAVRGAIDAWQQRLLHRMDAEALAALRSAVADLADAEALRRVVAGSDFCAQWIERYPLELAEALHTRTFEAAFDAAALTAELDALLAAAGDDRALLKSGLRQVRNRRQVRLIWRDLNGLASLEDLTGELSATADAVIDAALRWVEARFAEERGLPLADGERQHLVVLGMGKLGAGELNLSSDVDLVFVYPRNGQVQGPRPTTNHEYFLRLGRALVDVLDERTEDGFVYRVDMRLRPWGSSGPLACSFNALREYYETQGRDWERYALIKARPVAGDLAAGEELLADLRPFIYRRYLDWGAIDALRDMKALINRERAGPGYAADVKLGSGGIREVEFIAQVFQLIRGGQDRRLQQRSLLSVLLTLAQVRLLPPADVRALSNAYRYLRGVEHRLQALADQQTQRLPSDAELRQRLAWGLDHQSWEAFLAELDGHRELVTERFAALIAEPQHGEAEAVARDLVRLWQEPDLDDAAILGVGFSDPERVRQALARLRGQAEDSVGQAIGRERLDELLPHLLGAAADLPSDAQQPIAESALERALALVVAVLRRTTYLKMLEEHPGALRQLVRLCADSLWISDTLARWPVLLEELLDVRRLYTVPDRAGLREELRLALLRVPPGDLEWQMDVLRHFKHAHLLRVAACEVAGELPLMRVSDHLTWLAEALLETVVELAWDQITARHGWPEGVANDGPPPFLVVGYGKLGGLELGPGSDLDLVFLHAIPAQGTTDGARPVAHAVFLNRWAQRLVHLLTTQTRAGTLYEVDTRLRPSGRSGLLVTSLEAFHGYQQAEAWTWEHQALVRARPVAGSDALARRFAAVREEILGQPRERETLRADILKMRERMLKSHAGPGQSGPGAGDASFDLKRDPGGIVDIEFVVQYTVLAWASVTPDLMRYTDNVRILEAAAGYGHLSGDDASRLTAAYLALRSEAHRATLDRRSALTDAPAAAAHRAAVREIWERVLAAPQPAG